MSYRIDKISMWRGLRRRGHGWLASDYYIICPGIKA
jgi:hypothetical protein